MQLVQYFICIATRHERTKYNYEEEIRELQAKYKKNKHKYSKRIYTLPFDNETTMIEQVIASVCGKPTCLKPLSAEAIVAFAYILKDKLANEHHVVGSEIIDRLVYDPEKTIEYLNGLGQLKEHGWIKLIVKPGISFTDQPPFCWLQSSIELGPRFHEVMGASQDNGLMFTSNDAYLDGVFAYLHEVVHGDSTLYKVSEPDADLMNLQPEGWNRRIVQRAQVSTCELPAAEAQKKYGLSVFQLLALAGLLGMREGDVRYDFSTPSDVAFLFAQGRICRKRMKEHLYGEKSPLIQHRLLEGSKGAFGETVQLTHLGSLALYGTQNSKTVYTDLENRIKKRTLFDIETPIIKKESLQLPHTVLEAIQSLLFSESSQGRQIRKEWQSSLPTAWGSPTGSTVLLYGPPGTGKTLTAQYLASELQLPLLKIDASRVLSCWVGESEQRVRRIFDDYSNLQNELGNSPVLLLNEADQLLGARGGGANSVDRMNNNMQNLFLEGLERFSGILVATTNRRDLLDEAFSRRFTYKLELPPPDRNLRMALWKSHLPMERLADDVQIEDLADLGLTGGEIRLVIERAVRLLAYRGITSIDRKTLTDISKEEIGIRMKRSGSISKIGFAASSNM